MNVSGNIQYGMYNGFSNLEFVTFKVFDFYQLFERTKSVNNVRQEFINTVRDFQPDLVHMQLQMTNILDVNTISRARATLKNKKCIFTNWSGDVRNSAAPEIVSISEAVDFTLISSVGQLELYRKAGCKNVQYWQIGYDPLIFHPKFRTQDFKYDLVFAGNYYAAATFADAGLRNNLVMQLKKRLGHRFAVFGRGYPGSIDARFANPNEINEIYNSSKCIFSMSNYNDISSYFSDRLLTCLASGRPVISYRFPQYQNYFSDNQDLFIASSIDEVVDKMDFCINNSMIANEVGYNGYLKVKHQHTYESRVVELLNMLGLYE